MNEKQQYIDALNNYYDKIYLLFLERNNRKEVFVKNLQGLNYTLFNCIDGLQLTQAEIEAAYDDKTAKPLIDDYFEYRYGVRPKRSFKIGEIACAMTHGAIYKDIVDNNYKRALILEDDAKIDWSTVHLIPGILKDIPNDCELFYWGYRWYDNESKLHRVKRLYLDPLKRAVGMNAPDLNERYPKPFKNNVWHAGFHGGGHAYGITKATAAKLIQLNTPITRFPDMIFAESTRDNTMKTYVAMPRIILNDQSVKSTIVIGED